MICNELLSPLPMLIWFAIGAVDILQGIDSISRANKIARDMNAKNID
jgi:hypothetical protein